MYEFDLKTFLKHIYTKRKRLYINCAIAFVLSLIFSFSIPKTYTSRACLVPEIHDDDAIGGNLGSLASAAGFNLGNVNDAIGPDLYPDVLHSNSFVIDLLYSMLHEYSDIYSPDPSAARCHLAAVACVRGSSRPTE